MFCANCGKQIKDGSKFCVYCGAAQGETPAPVTPPTPAAAVPPRVLVSQPPVAVQQPAPLAPMPAAQPVAVMPKQKKKKPVAAIVAGILVVVAALAGAGYFVVLPMVHRHQWQTGMQEAGQALAAQNYRSALRTLEEADDTLPDQLETKVQLARAYAGTGDLDRAEAYMQELSDARVSEAPYTAEDDDVHDFYFRNPHEALLKIGDYVLESGEETLCSCYYSAPDENTHCLTWWGQSADTSYKQGVQYYDQDWKPLKRVTYDKDGTVSAREEYTYDNKSDVVRDVIYFSDGSIREDNQYTYDENGNKTTYEYWYTSSDRTQSFHDKYTYDANGNVVKEENYGWGDKFSGRYEYTYDADGNKIGVVSYDENGLVSYRYEYKYDENGNQISYTCYNSNGEQSGSYFTYDEHGNVTKETAVNRDGTEDVFKTYTYSYDDSGNILVKNVYNSTSKKTNRYEYTYDENGNQLSEIQYNNDGSVGTKYTYNSDGLTLTAVYNDDNGNALGSYTYTYENGYETGYKHWDKDDGTYEEQHYFIDPTLLKATAVG